jgi:Ca2+-binding RTX toxin-like protein
MVHATARLRALALTLAVPGLLGVFATAAHAEGDDGAIKITLGTGQASVTSTDTRATNDLDLDVRVSRSQLTVTSNTRVDAPGCKSSNGGRTAKCKNVQYATVQLGAGNDAVKTGGDGAVILQTGAGNDAVTSTGLYLVAIGGDGDDTITASSKLGVSLVGGAGNDTLVARGGTDFQHSLQGGPGNDTLIGSTDGDRLEGGEGDDVLLGDAGNDNLIGGPGSDSFDGGTGSDLIIGDNSKADNQRPLPGNDHVYYAKVKGAWSVTNNDGADDGSLADRTYEDIAHTQVRFDEVWLVEGATKGAMPR